jgi:hypothetical protein
MKTRRLQNINQTHISRSTQLLIITVAVVVWGIAIAAYGGVFG